MSFARAVYTALTVVVLPAALAKLAWRSRREPDYAAHVPERLGRYAAPKRSRPLIWIHAVSVGETRAAEPLVRVLRARYPDHAILMTHMTPTGRRTSEELFGDTVLRAYLPYDFPRGVARFLDHFAPRVGVIMETEIWPNLVAACEARGVPLVLANARLSERSAPGYRRLGALAREAVGAFSEIGAQTADDARRFEALGARAVTVTGSLKFDVAPPLQQLARGRAWRESYGPRPVLLAASTRAGEEALVLDAFAQIAGSPLLVLVPRHPQRFDEVASLLRERGLRYARRSAADPVAPDIQVLLGDSMGEMPAYYAACDLAFVGGSLVPSGGQNFIEACAVGTPVLLGPHTYNFAEAAARAIAGGAAIRVDNPADLARVATRLLRDEEARARMTQHGLAFAHAHQGATAKVMRLIEEVMK